MEIHNNSDPYIKGKVNISKTSAKKSKRNQKNADAQSLDVLASYGKARLYSAGFNGKKNNEDIVISDEERQNILNALNIPKKNETETSDEILHFEDLYKKENINELSIIKKKELVRKLAVNNSDTFEINKRLSNYFPILPKTREEYCELMSSIAKSIGLETNILSEKKLMIFTVL